MGNSPSFDHKYSVPVRESNNKNQSAVYRASSHPDSLVQSLVNVEVNSCWELFQMGVKENPSGKCLGRRRIKEDKTLGEFEWSTFSQVETWAIRLGTMLMNSGACPELKFPDEIFEGARCMRMVGLFSKNRCEWFVTEQAANAFGISIVPLYDTLGEEAIRYILDQTCMEGVCVSIDCLDLLLKVASNSSSIKHVICYDNVDSDKISTVLSTQGITIHLYTDIVNNNSAAAIRSVSPGIGSNISTICYTSGTTGNPKGVLLSQSNFTTVVCSALRGPLSKGLDVTSADSHISYLPLAHVFERIICNVVLSRGGAIGVYSGDTMKLLEDVRELKPTIFISVPRLFNRINDRVFGGIKDKSSIAQYLFNSGMSTKLINLRRDATVTHPVWDKLVFNKIKLLMGGRLRYMVAGGAPLDALIEERMKIWFCARLMEGYGLTETLGASFITTPRDPLSGHVGGPLPCLEFKLESVPEMEYLVTDENPKGELLLAGPALCKGYFKNPEETKRAFDSEGWFHTGDIVVLLPNGGIKIIDRKKNIFKLAQGEYVAPEKIEGVYNQAGLVAQVFAFGYSSKVALVGVVVPDAEGACKWAAARCIKDNDLASLCRNTEFKKAVQAEMEVTAKEGGLKGFEKLKDIYLSDIPFTAENGLLTPTFKLKRHQARQQFETQIDAMYKELES